MFKARLIGTGFTLVCLLALHRPASGQALEVLVTESGGPTIPILDNGPLDIDPSAGSISVNAGLLDLSLVNYHFDGLQVNSLTSGLSMNGMVDRIPGGNGSVTITASADSFLAPSSNPKTMTTAASDNFNSVIAGDSRTFQSFFNPSNVLGGQQMASPLLAFVPPSGSSSSSNPGVPTVLGLQPVPYSLTNTTVITFDGIAGNDTFSGTTTITASVINGVPEPGAYALLSSLGLTGAAFLRRRRAR